ncbi:MAG: NADH-quinone oxidoreductase subunit M [Rickettsiales bacterium]|nr:NADH-quinone oxidoreductase subunit M [Pseudomonadota bacterium]MDA0966678.1 NADH-quinone oxidoreductase subunit M [Pseudomonadota bacterium]MDG4543706.1 NADH-quinone oxidoreductase subunit M [Rickettsiales bacterium]MDG4545853.1 NADH-quinone oxidoreductase subunit M [Rickettsiales bacterium]MDG4547373.1 NADH-quinone oxidoreductase subunit M [Rickettsiales bacterium]
MSEFPILSILIFLPLIGALFIAFFVRGDDKNAINNAKNTALWVTIGTFVFSLSLWLGFDSTTHEFQFVHKIAWIQGYNIYYYLGIDGISLFFVLLTTFLMPICILAGWNTITKRVREYMIAFLLLETMIIGVFCALDLILFYIFFEAVLIPMFLIIGVWGGEQRIYASFKFFLYTLTGSVLLLIAILYMYNITGTSEIPVLMEQIPHLPLYIQKWLWLALFASFAVKVPMWPVHTWLPDAHVQAPTAGSVILAGILLKLGGYGFLRLSLPLLPDASVYYADFVFFLSVVAIIYTSLVALVQTDMKKLIAYSSVAHMGFVTLGTFALNRQGIEGSLVVMISHGLVSAALFLCVGSLYDRVHTKEIKKYGGVVERMPRFAMLFMLFTMASIGLPGTSGFVGELLSLVGVFQVNKIVTALAATGVILGAAYMLWLYARVVFGEITNKDVDKMKDIGVREGIMYVSIAVLVIILGVYPAVITDLMSESVIHLVKQINLGTLN